MMKTYLDKLIKGETLSESEMIAAMTPIMEGAVTEAQIAAFLMGLAMRGETVPEITGAARVLRAKAHALKAPADAVDCCGTGGDYSGSFNISTAVALVAAACGVPVAKHGNRASSSQSGTADVLEALGVPLEAPQKLLEEALQKTNFAFLMAPHHHPAMGHVREVRKELGVRTLFNLIGPLSNPAGTRLQLIGVYDHALIGPIAEVLCHLGTREAWVVHGADGLDEISVCGPSHIAILKDGKIEKKTLTPDDFGLKTYDIDDLKGGTAKVNAKALTALLDGAHGAYRDIVLANTAAVLVIHGDTKDLREGVKIAAKAIDDGKAAQVLKDYIAFLKQKQAAA